MTENIRRAMIFDMLREIISKESRKQLEPDTYEHGYHFGVVDTCRALIDAVEQLPEAPPPEPHRVLGDHRTNVTKRTGK